MQVCASDLLSLVNLDSKKGVKMKKLIFIFFSIYSFGLYAYIDLNLGYSFSMRRVDGVETETNPDPGAAVTTSTGYQVNLAWFMWEYTGLDLNYSHTTERLQDNREVATNDSSITIKEIDSTVITEVAGIGIRQAFASRKSTIIPSLAIGYAQYTTSGTAIYTLDNGGSEAELEIEQDKEVFSSGYAAFSLRFRFTQLMGLTLAAKTIMPDFDTEQADNNVTYSAGFSWIF